MNAHLANRGPPNHQLTAADLSGSLNKSINYFSGTLESRVKTLTWFTRRTAGTNLRSHWWRLRSCLASPPA
jgi:hypothetical protein